MNLIPYLTFEGNCEKALKRYQEIFDGEVVYLQRFKDGPEMGISEEFLDRVMHAQLQIGEIVLYLSDNFPGTPLSADSRIGLNLALEDQAEQKRIFEALSINGKITMPLEEQFWGDTFGSLVDEFGIPWSLNYSNTKHVIHKV